MGIKILLKDLLFRLETGLLKKSQCLPLSIFFFCSKKCFVDYNF